MSRRARLRARIAGYGRGMSGNGYKALGFVVWKGGIWYLKRRYGVAKRVGTGALAAGIVGVVGAAALARRRNGHSHPHPHPH